MTSTRSTGEIPWAARAYAALLLGVSAVQMLLDPPRVPSPWLWLSVLAVPLLARFPLTIMRQSSGIEIGLDPVIVLFLGFAEPSAALPIWAAGAVLSQIAVVGRPVGVRLLNVALCALAGVCAVETIELVPHSLDAGPLGVVAAALAGLAYFAVDYLGSAIGVVLLGRASLRETIWDETVGLVGACAGGVASLGYLGAVVLRHEHWAFPLVAVPVATVVFAGHAFARAHEERLRTRALFDAAASLQGARTVDDVRAAVLDAGRRALRTLDVSLVLPDSSPATHAERPDVLAEGSLVAALQGSEPGTGGSLVAGARRTREPFTADDAHTVDLLASLAAESLRRVGIVSELEQLAGHDTLTGLLNARSFRAALQLSLDTRPAVLFCDLDGFKDVNDTLGHDAGDDVLRTIAGRLRACLRPGDHLGRLGGDEFALVLPGVDRAEAEAVADRILAAVRPPVTIGGVDAHLGVSIGVAAPGTEATAPELMRQADIAMYAAKAAGKSQRVVCTPQMYAGQVSRQALSEELRGAGERGELVLHYQPVVDLVTGAVDGVEALVRWQHPERGLLAPDAFIPLAEESGLIDELTRWVLGAAAQASRELNAAAGRQLTMSVNISSASLLRGIVADAVARTARPGYDLVVEVPEAAMADARAVPVLEELRRRGVRVAIDDFGTGTSSLAALRVLPFDMIKLDRWISADLTTDVRARRLVGAVVELACALSKDLVVEGVESLGQEQELRGLGITRAQGFHLGRPMQQGSLEALLTTSRVAQDALAG